MAVKLPVTVVAGRACGRFAPTHSRVCGRRSREQGGQVRKPSVDDVLDQLPRDHRELVSRHRETVTRMAPDAEESVLWGGLSYHRPKRGGRVKGAVCRISCKRDEVRLEFIHGIRLDDPTRRLLGDAVSERYVFIRSIRNARDSAIACLIRQAARPELGRPSELPLDPPDRPVTGRARGAWPAPVRPAGQRRR